MVFYHDTVPSVSALMIQFTQAEMLPAFRLFWYYGSPVSILYSTIGLQINSSFMFSTYLPDQLLLPTGSAWLKSLIYVDISKLVYRTVAHMILDSIADIIYS
jgi:hypothetical protein